MVSAGPPTSGNSIVLISRPLAGSAGISERWGPGLNSPLRNLGNNNFPIQLKSRLIKAQVIKISNNQTGTITTPRKAYSLISQEGSFNLFHLLTSSVVKTILTITLKIIKFAVREPPAEHA